jgi:hypothetical protein
MSVKIGYVIDKNDNIFVQIPSDNQFGFSIASDDQTWEGGIGLGEWMLLENDDPRITEDVKESLQWIIDENQSDPNTIQINLSSLTDAVIEYIEAVDRLQCHIHLRIDAEGNAYCDKYAGYCVSQDEYNLVPGHVRTVKHQQGHGQCNLDDSAYTGWKDTDDGIEEINSMIETVIEDLERDGFKVELI